MYFSELKNVKAGPTYINPISFYEFLKTFLRSFLLFFFGGWDGQKERSLDIMGSPSFSIKMVGCPGKLSDLPVSVECLGVKSRFIS